MIRPIQIACTLAAVLLMAAPAVGPVQAQTPLTLDALKNAKYSLDFLQTGVAKLSDGVYTEKIDPNSATELRISLIDPLTAFGDLDGDGVDDAAVVLVSDPGGGGAFFDLAVVLNQDGKAVNVAHAPLGDRVKLQPLVIEKGVIAVKTLRHGPNDPRCCPSLEVVHTYVLRGNTLLLTSQLPPRPAPTATTAMTTTTTITTTTPAAIEGGLTVAQVSMDTGSLADSIHGETRAAVPYDPDAAPELYGEPANLRFVFDDDALPDWVDPRMRQLLVYPVSEYQKMYHDAGVADIGQRIGKLAKLIKDQPRAIPGDIPVLPSSGALQAFRAQVKYLKFNGGAGVRFVTQYIREPAPAANDRVFYTFQGLTDDGKYYVSLFYPVSISILPSTATNVSATDLAQWQKDWHAYVATTVRALNDLQGAGYSPQLAELDAMVQSLTLGGQ